MCPPGAHAGGGSSRVGAEKSTLRNTGPPGAHAGGGSSRVGAEKSMLRNTV